MPVDTTDTRMPVALPGDGRELAVLAPHLDRVEHPRDALDAGGVTGQQDVLGELARRQVDVVLAVGLGQGHPAVADGQHASSVTAPNVLGRREP